MYVKSYFSFNQGAAEGYETRDEEEEEEEESIIHANSTSSEWSIGSAIQKSLIPSEKNNTVIQICLLNKKTARNNGKLFITTSRDSDPATAVERFSFPCSDNDRDEQPIIISQDIIIFFIIGQ